jgi:cyclophilin family peptidyl-prolyl cis-trans isomerase/protein-disulfide isomerase
MIRGSCHPGAELLLSVMLFTACSSLPPPEPTPEPSPTMPAVPTTATMGCRTVSMAPTPSEAALIPTPASSDFSRGPINGPVTLIAYCDLQSSQCELFNQVLDRLMQYHAEELRVVFRPFPVPASIVASLDKSELSMQAALAAGNQGRFWEIRGILQDNHSEWAQLAAPEFEHWITQKAKDIGLDTVRFAADLTSTETVDRSRGLYEAATSLGISSIPTIFINGRLQERPALSYEGLESSISLIALGSRQFRACPPFDIDPSRKYLATLRTEKGDIAIQLYADRVPLAVNSFVFLARQGWFEGTTFHRVIPGFLAQGGDPSGTGHGGPGYYFENEVFLDLLFDRPGVLGLANSGPDTNGSQFFITYAPQPQLDGSYTVFGQVTAGMDVVESLTPRDPQLTSGLPPGDRILSVIIKVR